MRWQTESYPCTQRTYPYTKIENQCSPITVYPKYQWIGLSSDPNISKQAIINALTVPTDFYTGGATFLDSAMSFIDGYTSSAEFAKYNQACSTTMVIVLSDGLWNTDNSGNVTEANLSYAVAQKLAAKTPSIKTFSVAFGIDPATVSTFTKLALAGGTKIPYGGVNVNADQLAGTFLSLIQSVMFETFTTVAPLIIPKSGELTDDLIVTPEFEYNPVGQWKGYLRADALKSDGTFGDNKWEFGKNLYANDPAARKIWTAACEGGACTVPTKTNKIPPNNLTAALPVGTLRAMFETTGTISKLTADQDALNLLKFIRGEDVFDEDKNPATTKRWMLNDVYNSKPIFVGPPALVFPTSPNYVGGDQYFYNLNQSAYETFRSKWRTRKPVIYAGSNGGVVHAIHAVTGQELWAFVPPALLQNFKSIISSQPNSSNSIYGVDGPLVAKDVYTNGEWRTYLAIMLGKGARGFSVLDVTDPDFPLHVVSAHNDFPKPGPVTKLPGEDSYHPGSTRCFTRYRANGSVSPVCDTGGWFSALGHTSTEPVFSYAFYENQYQPILIISAGDGDSITGTGSAVYNVSLSDQSAGSLTGTNFTSDAINPLQGAYVRKTISSSVGNLLNIESTTGINSGAIVSGVNVRAGSRVTEIVSSNTLRIDQSLLATVAAGADISFQVNVDNEILVRPEVIHSGQSSFMQGKYGRLLIAPNSNGYVHSFNESSSSPNTVPFNANGKILLNSGTNPANDRLIHNPVTLSALTYSATRNFNILYGTGEKKFSAYGKQPDNFVASFQDLDSNIFVTGAGTGWTKVCSAEIPSCYRPKYVSPAPTVVNSVNFLNVSNAKTPTCPIEPQKGWVAYFNETSAIDIVSGVTKSCSNAKLWQQIEVSGGVAKILGYIPPAQTSGTSNCVIGDSFIQFRDPACGYQIGSGGVYLSNTIIGGITTFRDKVYLSLSRNRLASQQLPPADKMIISGNKAVLVNPPKAAEPFKNPGVIKSKIRIQ
jgi:hypothetical protein